MMKAKILDETVLVYGDIAITARPVIELAAGDEVELGIVVGACGREWIEIRDHSGAVGFIDRGTRVKQIGEFL